MAVPVARGGQLPLVPDSPPDEPVEAPPADSVAPVMPTLQQPLLDAWDLDFSPAPPTPSPIASDGAVRRGLHAYPLRTDTDAPKKFFRAVVSIDQEAIHRDIVAQFDFDDELILKAQQTAVHILMEEVEIFGHTKDKPETIRADLAQREIDAMAQRTLFAADTMDVIDVRELNEALLASFKRAVDERGIDAFDTQDKLIAGLNKILALRPGHLKKAISEVVARHTESEEASPIPATLSSATALRPARLNLYGVFPDDLNTWEVSFANDLDNDTSGTVKWWHRNPVRKPFSISIPLPGQPDFYPDFVVGIKDRRRGNGVLLMETKRDINDEEGNAQEKAQVEHPTYKKVMMLYWEQQQRWMTVEYDARADKNILDRVLRPELMVGY